MTAYATLVDVQALNARRTAYSGSTKPTSTQVQGFVDQIAAEIDVILDAAGVATPVASPVGFVSRLKLINAYGAAALAEMSSFPESDGGPGSTPQGARYERMYQAALKTLMDGTGIPSDALTRAAGRVLTRSYATDYPNENASYGSDAGPRFSIGKEW